VKRTPNGQFHFCFKTFPVNRVTQLANLCPCPSMLFRFEQRARSAQSERYLPPRKSPPMREPRIERFVYRQWCDLATFSFPPLVGCLVRIELAYQMPCRSVLEPPWRYSFRSRQRHSAPFAKVLGYCVWNLVRVEIACGGSSGSRGGVLRGRGTRVLFLVPCGCNTATLRVALG